MSDEQQTKSGCTWLQLIVAFGVLALLFSAAMPRHGKLYDKAYQAASAGDCRQILAALKLYADDHEGEYPDAHESNPNTSNDAFRFLIHEGILDDERVFGGKQSKYRPDNDIGDPPNYPKALEAGENHWAMTKGVTLKSPVNTPLVFENPNSASWPPMWNVDAAGKMVKGRAWKGGKIIVGLNDGSVQTIKLESAKGVDVLPAREADGKDVFTRAGDALEMLDILE